MRTLPARSTRRWTRRSSGRAPSGSASSARGRLRPILDPRIAGRFVKTLIEPPASATSPLAELSERETEVLRLIALGYANKEITAQLNLSVKTIETYQARSMEKLGLRSRVDIMRLAAERGWLHR